MGTLVIHPDDRSTDFLSAIYEGKDWTVMRHYVSSNEIKDAIKAHDRIIMMGHGSDEGLYGKYGGLLITSELVYLLREKYCVCIWCYAKEFFEKYKLKGKYTDMIISELEEANYMNVATANASHILQSNNLFALTMRDFVNDEITLGEAIEQYKDDTNPVIEYNRVRIFENTSI